MSRSAVRAILGILLIVILVGCGVGALVWWKISRLKEQLVLNLESAIGAQVTISSLDIDPWKGELHAAGIALTNQNPSAPWDSGDISQVTVHFKLRDLFASTLPLSLEVSSWNLALHGATAPTTASPAPADADPADAAPAASSTSPKGRIEVTQITAKDGTVQFTQGLDKKIILHGVSFQSADNGGGIWNTQLQATSISAGSFDGGATSVQIRGEADKISFSDLRTQCAQGIIMGAGDVGLTGTHDVHIDLKAVDVPMSMLVAVEWQMKLSGLASGELHYTGNDATAGDATGNLAVTHGKFNVFPWLGKVTSLVGLQDISDVEVDKATSDFEWKAGALHLTNIDIRKDGVTRIAGNVDIDAQDQVDGKIKLGLPSTVTSKWPQLQAQVFPVQMDDCNWADVHLTGTPDHLQEDLTPRLLAVSMGQGGDLLNSAAQKASDLYKNFMGK
jgi:hypothetical protein